ncbi:hypothetical protein [Laspinema olomoucense]|uniref:hypothetical protein n=1 Tax=Laspinema olomoucense TaxID=3231600 RepID=UPI0021BB3E46|nr:hypothetical protein [Laspinema sp. D3c]MCT7997184.1 hypothetical protein [Laspinema sp. D3c]
MTFSTLIHLLQTRAHQQPNQIAYTFLKNGKTPTSQLTYRQLDQKAKAIAAYLQSQLPEKNGSNFLAFRVSAKAKF